MEGLQRWAVVVCTAAVVCTLLQRLFPETSIGRQGRLLLPCVFLCAVLSPLAGGLQTVRLPALAAVQTADKEQLTAHMKGQVTERLNTTLLAMANQALESHGLQAEKIVTDMDIDEEGCIHTGQITVYVTGDSARWSAAVRQIVRNRLGMDVTVARWEETS